MKMKTMAHKFAALHYSITHAHRILLLAHTRPDPDTIGATTALYSFLCGIGKSVTLACADTFPNTFDPFLPPYTQTDLSTVTLSEFDLVIGADNIDRGFGSILKKLPRDHCVTVGIDHHPHTAIRPDILITNPQSSSTCEIIYQFFTHIHHTPSSHEAAALLIGILGDTRIFQNNSTDAATLSTVASLAERGISPKDIISSFMERPIATLSLWGTALRNAVRVNPSGAIITALDHTTITRSNIPTDSIIEELKEVASLLANTPDTPFAMMLIQVTPTTIKGSIRAERDRNTDTAQIASLFGGGGHTLASGFEVRGRVIKKDSIWHITAS